MLISSTFWTERIGPSAALKTLEVMGRERSWEAITGIGNMVRAELQKLATTHDLKIAFAGIPALTSFSFGSQNELAYKTLIAQEMLKQGYLATNLIYASIAHTPRIIEGYIEAMDRVFPLIKACEDGGDPNDLLEGAVCRSGRLLRGPGRNSFRAGSAQIGAGHVSTALCLQKIWPDRARNAPLCAVISRGILAQRLPQRLN